MKRKNPSSIPSYVNEKDMKKKLGTRTPLTTMATTEENCTNESIPFLLRPPVDEHEVKGTEDNIRAIVETAWNTYKSGGVNGLRQFIDDNCVNKHAQSSHEDLKSTQVLQEEAEIKGDARRYQSELFERAKARNTIISLGTGQGKTLIAIMAIRHFAQQHFAKPPTNPKGQKLQTWFLVPSVALAVQQSCTLQANLPYRIATACHTAACSEKARVELSNAQIVVATHGSALELLRHFGDMFSLSRVNLLVLDECHHAIKKNNYAVIMQKFYHTLEVDRRPHVVGLTASPIINVPKNVTNGRLEELLSELENTLDASLVSISTLGLSKEEAGVIESNVQETLIEYDNTTNVLNFPSHENIGLHKSRNKELEQLKYLYKEFGPAIVQSYTDVLLNEISRNHFERESLEQHQKLNEYLCKVRDFSRERCLKDGEGKSGKLKSLQNLLMKIYNTRGIEESNDIVGIIFVERRITALALKQYLCNADTMCTGDVGIGKGKAQLRCDLLTRQSTHVFKYLSASHKLTEAQQQTAHTDWLHKMNDSREVLDKLRRREVDLLICTSVVEEGVDVDACSFVIVLDDMKTTKGYIQMKGRARQLNAEFFVFENTNEDAQQAPVSLSHASKIESQITDFIGGRHSEDLDLLKRNPIFGNDASLRHVAKSFEDDVLEKGEYHSLYGSVDFMSAKSLVNRYALSVPMDINSRSSRAALQPYLPVYSSNILCLPSHLPQNIRRIKLPKKYNNLNKVKKQSMLALIACVRLHKLNILNDRLLPLQRQDIHKILMKSALTQLRPLPRNEVQPRLPKQNKQKEVFIYPILQSGSNFVQHSKVLHAESRSLCIISLKPLRSKLSLQIQHSQLGIVRCQFGTEIKDVMRQNEWLKCTAFYSVIINSRWRRRTGKLHFRYRAPQNNSVVPSYIVGCMSDEHTLDYQAMDQAICDYNRTENERKLAVKQWIVHSPRLWAPLYDPNNTYIAFHEEEGVYASSQFPRPKFSTFGDYFLKTWSFPLANSCPMYRVQRIWQLPNKVVEAEVDRAHISNEGISRENDSVCDGNQLCHDLQSNLLPHEACMEAPLPDAALYLHCVLLPQILYAFDRLEATNSFIVHCSDTFPKLARYMNQIKIDKIIEVITAKSCGLSVSYDRLEYLGDAVLKLLQTDALINSKNEELRHWIHCLHEGDLTDLRSAMGCNERLKEAAECAGIDSFILTRPLSRGQWVPKGLEAYKEDSDDPVHLPDFTPSEKVKADVIEALLGIIYVHFGYESAIEVAEQLGISLPKETEHPVSSADAFPICQELVRKASAFLSMKEFRKRGILLEAVTHPSKIHSNVPSYQRLEWVGDAVLCLAAREWVYMTYPRLAVKGMVQIETTIVCNETLALLARNSGLQRYIIHCDSTLPSHLDKYELCAKNTGQGLWGTDPPKVLADIVEALLGVAHIDGGFKQGQKSANFVIEPMTAAILSHEDNTDLGTTDEQRHMLITHPKQTMLELCETLKVKATASHEFMLQASSRKIWQGKAWERCSEKITSDIGEVSWCGVSLCAVADNTSKRVAQNRACALVSSTLQQNPALREKLIEMSEKLNKKK